MDKKYQILADAIVEGDDEAALEAIDVLLEQGFTPLEIFGECIQDTLNELGEQFARLEIFLPELILASDVVTVVQQKLKPLMQSSTATKNAGRIVIGTAYGDLHDIGKNMVSLMLSVNGFEVRDLGTSVDAKAFIDAAEDFNADIIAISALMLPTLPYMKDTIEMVKGNPALAKKIKVMVGGGPVNQMWADEVGADGYSNDALEAVKKAQELIASLR